MGDPVPAVAGRVAPWKWGVVWLLFLATVINYMDRQTYTALSGPIKAAFTSEQSVAGREERVEVLGLGEFQDFVDAGFHRVGF